jgi:hypothetical protein
MFTPDLYHCSILLYLPPPLRRGLALPRQHLITFSVLYVEAYSFKGYTRTSHIESRRISFFLSFFR